MVGWENKLVGDNKGRKKGNSLGRLFFHNTVSFFSII